jgi:type II secretory pathway component PulJ
MSAHVHSAIRRRFTLPVWLVALAVALLAAIALAAFALLDGSTDQSSALSTQPISCVDSSVVGHC